MDVTVGLEDEQDLLLVVGLGLLLALCRTFGDDLWRLSSGSKPFAQEARTTHSHVYQYQTRW